jgi:hypothetical protein
MKVSPTIFLIAERERLIKEEKRLKEQVDALNAKRAGIHLQLQEIADAITSPRPPDTI